MTYSPRTLRILHVAGLLCVGLTLGGLAGSVWWVFELFSHFRIQYFASLATVSVLFAVGRRYLAGGMYATCAAVNLWILFPSYMSQDGLIPRTDEVLGIVSINVHSTNQRYDLVRAFILERDPDFLLLLEAGAEWRGRLAEVYELYPYSIEKGSQSHF